MPIGTYTMLKGTKPAFEEKSSANYYAYGPSGSVATYKKISGLITLPDKVRLVETADWVARMRSWILIFPPRIPAMVGIRIASSWIRRSMLAITLMDRKIFIRRIRSVEMMPILRLTMQNRHALKLCRTPTGEVFTSL